MSPFFRLIPIIVFLAVLPAATPLWAATDQKNPDKPPVHVEADRMVSLKEENAVHFTGKVEARQGSLVVQSDEMTVYYLSAEEKAGLRAGEANQLKKLLAVGNVRVQGEGWVASGNKMDYFEQERKVLLTGKSRVWQDNNLVTGESILIYLDSGKSIVERSEKKNERVKAFFYSGSEGAGGPKK